MPKPGRLHLERLLQQARVRIQVAPEELEEARHRRNAIAAALLKEFPGSRVYLNGSVAHGDALTPLTDVDIGIVVFEAAVTHGPDKRGPLGLMNRAADAIRRELKEEYGELRVEVAGRKRSVLIRFRDPVRPGLPDFTADVIVAIDNPDAPGLFIPKVPSWDRSHPEAHTAMVLAAIEDTEVAFAHVVRLLKHWCRRHDKPMCSWNIKALALACLTEPVSHLDGLVIWFRYAIDELSVGETEDPAGVSDKPIKLNKPRGEVVDLLRTDAKHLAEAIRLADEGFLLLAHDELAKLFNDEEMLPRPDPEEVRCEEVRRYTEATRAAKVTGVAAGGIGTGAARPRTPVRSWAP